MSKPTIADKKPTVLELAPGETMTFTAKKTHLFSSNNFLLGKNNNWIKWSANLILVAVVGIIIYFMAIHNTNHLSSMPMTHHHWLVLCSISFVLLIPLFQLQLK